MDDLQVYYVDVLLPLHLPDTYTYRIPQELNGQVKVGARVVVQFGAKSARMYSALVRRIHQKAPHWKSKYIMAVLDEEPIVADGKLDGWKPLLEEFAHARYGGGKRDGFENKETWKLAMTLMGVKEEE